MDNIDTATTPLRPSARRATRERRRTVPILGPILLIGLGLLFLGQNLGLVPGDIWSSLWRLWPLLLVVAGIDLILGRSGWPATIGLLVVGVIVAALVAATAIAGQVGGWSWAGWPFGVAAPAGVERLTEDLAGARRATIEVEHGAGRLTLGALPAESTQLLDAELAHGENTRIVPAIDRRGDQAQVSLRARTEGVVPPFGNTGRQDWTINLSPDVPHQLEVQSGAGDIDLDLTDLAVSQLDVQAGAGSLEVALPRAAGRTDAHVQTGAAEVDLTVPEGVAARITIEGGLTETTIDQARFPKVGNHYQSPDYETAANRVDLDVETGVGSVTIR